MASPKKASDHIPLAADQGVDYLMGSQPGNATTQHALVTAAGSPESIDLEALGLKPMADTNYVVIADGETVARVTVDEDTKTTAGFDLLGAAAAEVVNLMVVGRVKGQP